MDNISPLHTERLSQDEALQAEITRHIKTERVLQKTVDQLRALLSRIADAYFALDGEGRLLELNSAAEAMIFHRPAADLRGKYLWEEYPSLAGGTLQHLFQAALQAGQDLCFKAPFPPGGLWFEVHALPWRGGLEIFLREIGERKELESGLRESFIKVDAREQELRCQLSAAREALQKKTEEQSRLERELRQTEEQLRAALEYARTANGVPPPAAGNPAGVEQILENKAGGRPADLRRIFAIQARFQHAIFKANQKFTATNARLSAGNKQLGLRNLRLGEELEKRKLLLEELERQKKQLDNQNELLSVIFETIPAGIAVISSLDHTFRYANPAFRLLTPDPEQDPLGCTLDEILSSSENFMSANQILQRVLDSGEPIHSSQYEHTFPDGSRRSHDIYLHPLDWEGRRAVLAILWETTALKEAQNRAEAAAARAQDYAARLEAANRELRSFAFIASHDLQEPLRKIQVFGDRLKAHSAGVLDDTSLVFLERMQNASRRMQEMITGLLAYSRVSTHNLPSKPIDLGQVAREVLSDLEVSIERASAQVNLGELPVIEADPLQMRQLLQNLIGNALKFRRPGIPTQIKVTSTSLSSELIRIEIADNGIGFDPNRASILFQPFSRLHGRLYEGTGMGLAICRKTVERHQGSIAVESSPGQGTTFYVTLPVVQNSVK